MFFYRYIIICAGISLIFLNSCGTKTDEINNNTKDSIINAELIKDTVVPVKFTQFLFDKTGKIIDSFPHNTSWIKFLDIGKKQQFPNGFASLQQTLNDSIHRVCELECKICEDWYASENFDTTYCKKEGVFIEQFKSTEGESYFNSINYLNYYFFLAEVDSCFISMDDTEYGLLNFMKLKTKKNKLEYSVKVIKEEWVNMCDNEKINWKNPVPVFLFEKGKVLESSFSRWEEIWDCGQKADYAPRYPYVEIKRVKSIFKRYPDYGSPLNALENPYFVFSYLLLDETQNELKNSTAKPYNMQLVTAKGEIRKGTGIDLNNDKHADVFWYDRIYMKGCPVQKRNTVLYLKIADVWTPVYINNFSRFY